MDAREEWLEMAISLIGCAMHGPKQSQAETAKQHLIDHLCTTPEGFVLAPVEPDDERLRRGLVVRFPAIFKNSLRCADDGPKTAEANEKEIAIMKKQYAAMFSAEQQ